MIARVRYDLDDEMATPIIVSESATHIVVAVEISKSALYRHRRFTEALVAVSRGYETLLAVATELRPDGRVPGGEV